MIKAAIFDYSWTLYEVETGKLYEGAVDLLNFLKQRRIKLGVVSRAEDIEKRKEDFKRLDLESYFAVTDIVPKGSVKTFEHIIEKFELKPKECLIIGDRVKSEILEGNKLGMVTVWIRQGYFKDETPGSVEEMPDYTVNSYSDLEKLLKKLINP